MNEMLDTLGRWQLDVTTVRERMYRAVWLLARGWSSSEVADALGRDAHTIGDWAEELRQKGPTRLVFEQSTECEMVSAAHVGLPRVIRRSPTPIHRHVRAPTAATCLVPPQPNRHARAYATRLLGPKRIKIKGRKAVVTPSGKRVVRDGFYIHGGNPKDAVSSGCIKSLDNGIFPAIHKLTGVKGAVSLCVGARCNAAMTSAVGAVLADFAGAFEKSLLGCQFDTANRNCGSTSIDTNFDTIEPELKGETNDQIA